jgi:hypothetical protein
MRRILRFRPSFRDGHTGNTGRAVVKELRALGHKAREALGEDAKTAVAELDRPPGAGKGAPPAVVERHHVPKAARALNLAQSAASHAIPAIEERHDTKLNHEFSPKPQATTWSIISRMATVFAARQPPSLPAITCGRSCPGRFSGFRLRSRAAPELCSRRARLWRWRECPRAR